MSKASFKRCEILNLLDIHPETSAIGRKLDKFAENLFIRLQEGREHSSLRVFCQVDIICYSKEKRVGFIDDVRPGGITALPTAKDSISTIGWAIVEPLLAWIQNERLLISG